LKRLFNHRERRGGKKSEERGRYFFSPPKKKKQKSTCVHSTDARSVEREGKKKRGPLREFWDGAGGKDLAGIFRLARQAKGGRETDHFIPAGGGEKAQTPAPGMALRCQGRGKGKKVRRSAKRRRRCKKKGKKRFFFRIAGDWKRKKEERSNLAHENNSAAWEGKRGLRAARS